MWDFKCHVLNCWLYSIVILEILKIDILKMYFLTTQNWLLLTSSHLGFHYFFTKKNVYAYTHIETESPLASHLFPLPIDRFVYSVCIYGVPTTYEAQCQLVRWGFMVNKTKIFAFTLATLTSWLFWSIPGKLLPQAQYSCYSMPLKCASYTRPSGRPFHLL